MAAFRIPRHIPRHILWWILAASGAPAATDKERWVYIPGNLQVAEQADKTIGLLERARAAGYTHALLADSKFSRLGTVPDYYFTNARRVKDAAAKLKMQLIPAVFPIGYSNAMLFHDPNLAEGLPVVDALFVVKDGIARHLADPDVHLPNPTMRERKDWGFVDDNLTFSDGAWQSPATPANARMARKLTVAPFRQYHVSVKIRTAGLRGGTPEIKALVAGDVSLQWSNLGVKPDEDWTTHDVTFNSLDHKEMTLYFGIWGGHQGTLAWKDPLIEECGLVNLLRRPGAPFVVRAGDGRVLREGTDFDPVADPKMGTLPWAGEYTRWHQPPDLHTRRLADGTRLRVSFYQPHVIYDEQMCICPSEPKTLALLRDEARRVHELWNSATTMMSHDEWRVLGWDESCRKRRLTPGQLVADNARTCVTILRESAPRARIAVWSDMFDPYHNAKKNYYLVDGDLTNSWLGLDRDVLIINWNSGQAKDSLRFFAGRGHQQLLAGYYDAPPANIRPWLAAAKDVKGIVGVMYTTWRNDYKDLETFAKELDAAGF